MICPHCQKEHPADTRFCPQAGKELAPPPLTQPAATSKKRDVLPILVAGIVLVVVILVAAAVLIILKLRAATGEEDIKVFPAVATTSTDSDQVSRIVFTAQGEDPAGIFLYDLTDGSITRLTDAGADNWGASWSADGSRILFTSNRDGNSEIYVMNADGSNQVNLTRNPGEDVNPDWSQEMRKIVFETMRDGNSEIYIMNADGSGQTRLTDQSEVDSMPRWSPDGSRIIFTALRDGNAEIYIMNADGSGQVNLTDNPADDDSATWSPDGSMIGFDSTRDGQWEFYTMSPDGSAQTRVTQNIGYYGFSDWSPDGMYIAYTAEDQGNLNVAVMTRHGSQVTTLAGKPIDEFKPRWSPGRVPGIYADPILLRTATTAFIPPEITMIPALSPTPISNTPVIPTGCGVQNGVLTAWAGNELSVIITITECKFTVMQMIGIINNEWVFISHYLDETITGADFSFVYSYDNQFNYQLSGKFTSSNTADMHLIFFAPFRFSDTLMITEDLQFDMTAKVE
jgi:TolB protein